MERGTSAINAGQAGSDLLRQSLRQARDGNNGNPK